MLWTLRCLTCGERDPRSWTIKPPPEVAKICCGETMSPVGRVQNYTLPHTSRPHRLSQKGFRPGYQEAFGRVVEDNHQFRELQRKHNTEDADPRDRDSIPSNFA